jgi:hypothetical protein
MSTEPWCGSPLPGAARRYILDVATAAGLMRRGVVLMLASSTGMPANFIISAW